MPKGVGKVSDKRIRNVPKYSLAEIFSVENIKSFWFFLDLNNLNVFMMVHSVTLCLYAAFLSFFQNTGEIIPKNLSTLLTKSKMYKNFTIRKNLEIDQLHFS